MNRGVGVGLAFVALVAVVMAALVLFRSSRTSLGPAIATDSGRSTDEPSVPPAIQSSVPRDRASSGRVPAPPHGLRIAVVDTRGGPVVGAPLAFAVRRPNEPMDRRFAIGRTTGPRGILAVADASDRVEVLRNEWGRDLSLGVAIDAAGVPSEVVHIEPDSLPETEIRLVAAGCGSAFARVLDADGVEMRGQISFELSVAEVRSRGDRAVTKLEADLATGVARFPMVPLGRQLQATVSVRDFQFEPLTVAGPTRDGEVIELVWRLPASHPILTGRFVGEDGAVLPGANGSFSSFGLGMRWVFGVYRADEEGRFRIVLPSEFAGRTIQDLEFHEGCFAGRTGRVCTRPESLDLGVGVHDLGALRFTTLPLLVTVLVSDASGQPVERASRFVGLGLPRSPSLSTRTLRMPLWRESAPGHLEFHGVADSDELELVVRSGIQDVAQPPPIPVRVGARDVRVVVPSPGSLTATVRGVEGAGSVLELVSEAKPDQRPVRSLGGNRFSELEPGLYTLRVRLPLERDPVLVLEHLKVEDGRPCADERLRAIDLRDRVRRVVLRATGPAGDPLRDLQVSAVTEDPNVAPIGRQVTHSGSLTLGVSKRTNRMLVEAPGHHGKTLADVCADTTVVLEPGTPIQVRLACGALPPGTSAFCTFQSARQDALFVAGMSGVHRPGETVAAGTLVPGQCTLVHMLKRGSETALLCRRKIEVRAQAEPQVIVVECSGNELAAALRELGL